jgi:DNA-binding NarL/FixJ family response regulator
VRQGGPRRLGECPVSTRQIPTRVLQQPITRRVSERPEIDEPGKIAIYAGFEFDCELHECLDDLDSVMIVGTVETAQSMVAMTAMSKADLAIVELDHGDEFTGLNVARAVAANSPACGIMVYTPALTPRGFQALWVYGSEQWSIITRASLANPAHIRATVKSVVRGLPWTEPGVQRQWAELGERPRSEEDRRVLMRAVA